MEVIQYVKELIERINLSLYNRVLRGGGSVLRKEVLRNFDLQPFGITLV